MKEFDLQDYDSLKSLVKEKNKKYYVKAISLDFKTENEIGEVEGLIIDGSFRINGASAIRRTASLSIFCNTDIYNMNYFKIFFGISKKIKLYIGTLDEVQEVSWFPMGVYIITDASFSHNVSNGISINLNLSDKMCLLNGYCGGTIPAAIDVDRIETVDSEGAMVTKRATIYETIIELVNHFGGEQLGKIIISDLDTVAKTGLVWTSAEEKGALVQTIDDKGNAKYEIKIKSGEKSEIKIYESGDYIGYQYVDFCYPTDKYLTANAGDTVVSILDKIKNVLGNYEYFYDLYGNFVWREIKDYTKTSKASMDLKNLTNEDYYIDITSGEAQFDLRDDDIISAYNNNPSYSNLKNDFVVWGIRNEGEGQDKKSYQIRYHICLEDKPEVPIIPSDYTDEEKEKFVLDNSIMLIKSREEDEYGIEEEKLITPIISSTYKQLPPIGEEGAMYYVSSERNFYRYTIFDGTNNYILSYDKIPDIYKEQENFNFDTARETYKGEKNGIKTVYDTYVLHYDDINTSLKEVNSLSYSTINENADKLTNLKAEFKNAGNEILQDCNNFKDKFKLQYPSGDKYDKYLTNLQTLGSKLSNEDTEKLANMMRGFDPIYEAITDIYNLSFRETLKGIQDIIRDYLNRLDGCTDKEALEKNFKPTDKDLTSFIDVFYNNPSREELIDKDSERTIGENKESLKGKCKILLDSIKYFYEGDGENRIYYINQSYFDNFDYGELQAYIAKIENFFITNYSQLTTYLETFIEAMIRRLKLYSIGIKDLNTNSNTDITDGCNEKLKNLIAFHFSTFIQSLSSWTPFTTGQVFENKDDFPKLETASRKKCFIDMDAEKIYTGICANSYTATQIGEKEVLFLFPTDWKTVLYKEAKDPLARGSSSVLEELNAEWYNLYELDPYPSLSKQYEFNGYKVYKGKIRQQLYNNPSKLNYYLDYITSNEENYNELKISNIGQRTLVVNNDKINCLFAPTIPDYVIIQEGNKKEIKECEDKGQDYATISTTVAECCEQRAISSYSAFEHISSLLNTYISYNNSVGITCLPMFFLEPNTRIKINDDYTDLHGDFLIKDFSINLNNLSTMTLNCSKVIESI